MASMGGVRPSGTDGSDFWHRESIAWQHRQSCINKARLKFDIVIHLMLSFVMFLRLLPCMLAFLGTSLFESVRKWDVPNARPWEFIWFISLLAAFLGWKAMPKNDTPLLKQYIIGSIVFGVVPVLYGLVDQADDLFAYITDKKQTAQILGFPAVLIWFMFLSISAQIHGLGLYFSVQLMKAWKPRSKKTR